MASEHIDVLIVGAGLSGVGAACQLRLRQPGRTLAILEARGAIGGTWDLFRYPGIRSDSDMHTLGYSFRPWTEARVMADGAAIRDYVRETARDFGIDRSIRFHHQALKACWSSEQAQWTVEVRRSDTDETVLMTCSFLFGCTGYYRYDAGYSPEFPGSGSFTGQIVHPQHWPEDLDCAGKRVVVIGSGATAMTLVPVLAKEASHVTLLQRSPSYVLSLPSVDPVAGWLHRILPARAVYPIMRWKNALLAMVSFQLSRRTPKLVRALLRRHVQGALPDGYDVDTHFAPRYDPWDQRPCFVRDGDLFDAIRSGTVSVVTDQIESFTPAGLELCTGASLEADIVVTATGLNLLALGGMSLHVDGSEVDVTRTAAYKGMMLAGVPNFALALGYTNASWTLKCDLVSSYVCRLLDHMDRHGYQVCTPVAPQSMELEPLIDLKSGYVRRGISLMPRQGPRAPWRLHQNYPRDVLLMRWARVDDEGMRFTTTVSRAAESSSGSRQRAWAQRFMRSGGLADIIGARPTPTNPSRE